MITELDNGVVWINQVYAGSERNMHISQYLLEGKDNEYILVDSGSDYHGGEAVTNIRKVVGDEGEISTVLLTHSILPHIEGLPRIKKEWPNVLIMSATNAPTAVGLGDAERKVVNSSREFSGREFSFTDPILTDIVTSNWIFDEETGTIFTAEGVGHYHHPHERGALSSDTPDGIAFDNIHEFHKDKLPYLEYVDPRKLRIAFENLFDEYAIKCIAPAHGNVVEEEDIGEYIDKVIQSAEQLSG